MAYQLIHEHISQDTIEAFEQLAAAAKDGHVIGAALVVLMRRRRYLVDTCGELRRDPTLARGIVCVLDDHLGDMVRHRTDSDTAM